jgi:probable phosphoglycerate mutase
MYLAIEGVTEVLLIRHGEQERDMRTAADFRDPPLSERGRRQAKALGESLAGVHFDAVFSSNLQRAHDTARAITEHHELEPKVIEDLREHEVFRDLPDNKPLEEIMSRELLRALQSRLISERTADAYPYSEGSAEFRKRTVNAVEQAIWTQRAERIAIVCHAGVINAYVSHIVKSPYDFIFGPDHTSVSVIAAIDNRRMVRRLNDSQHLRNGDVDLTSS